MIISVYVRQDYDILYIQVVTTELSAVRAAKDSSNVLFVRRMDTNVELTRTVKLTRARETDVSTADSRSVLTWA